MGTSSELRRVTTGVTLLVNLLLARGVALVVQITKLILAKGVAFLVFVIVRLHVLMFQTSLDGLGR